jgi:FG-GAP repeat
LHSRLGVFIFASLTLSFASAQDFSQQGSKLAGSGALANTGATQQEDGVSVNQGTSVALSADGNTALVGAPNDNGGVGAVWVFVRTSLTGTWSQQGSKLVANDASGDANLGQSVALSADGNTALVGGPGDNSKAGAAWVFTRANDGTWSQQGNKLTGTGASAAPATTGQGWSVSLSADGNTALVGGEANGGGAAVAWIFSRGTSGAWTQQGRRFEYVSGLGRRSLGGWQYCRGQQSLGRQRRRSRMDLHPQRHHLDSARQPIGLHRNGGRKPGAPVAGRLDCLVERWQHLARRSSANGRWPGFRS